MTTPPSSSTENIPEPVNKQDSVNNNGTNSQRESNSTAGQSRPQPDTDTNANANTNTDTSPAKPATATAAATASADEPMLDTPASLPNDRVVPDMKFGTDKENALNGNSNQSEHSGENKKADAATGTAPITPVDAMNDISLLDKKSDKVETQPQAKPELPEPLPETKSASETGEKKSESESKPEASSETAKKEDAAQQPEAKPESSQTQSKSEQPEPSSGSKPDAAAAAAAAPSQDTPNNAANGTSAKRSADEMEGVSTTQPQASASEKATTPAAQDTEMTDAPTNANLTPGTKNPRENEAGADAEEPAAKRAKTEQDEAAPQPQVQTPAPQTAPAPPASIPTPSSEMKPDLKAHTSVPMSKLQQKFLIRCLQGLKRLHYSRFYKEPVDPVKMNIPSYFTIVHHPMDMGTIESKLKSDTYVKVDEVIADFDLMINNAVTFNGPEHPVAVEGLNLQKHFIKGMSKLPRVDEVEPAVPEKKGTAKKAGGRKSSGVGVATTTNKSAGRRESKGGRASIGSQSQTFALSPDGMPLIRRDSTAADGRPKRSIHPPKRDLPYASKPKKKKYIWELKFCQEALDEMLRPKNYTIAAPFYVPVDPVALNIPNYHSIIKKPMDLSTISSKLKTNTYENAKEFEADVRLMFKNCYKFNIPGDPTFTCGQRLEEAFDKKWATKDRWLHAHEPPSVRAEHSGIDSDDDGAGAAPSDDEAQDSESDGDAEKLLALQRQMEELSKQVEHLSQKKKKTPPAPKKKATGAASSKAPRSHATTASSGPKKSGASATTARGKKASAAGGAGTAGKKDKRWVSYAEKQLISNVISSLPEKQMNEALSIIQRNAPSLIGSSADGEIELDIDELPNDVLLKLLNFVKKHAPQAVAELEAEGSGLGAAPAAGGNGVVSGAPARGEDGVEGGAKPKKNKPMTASEQEAQIRQLKDRMQMFERGKNGGGGVRSSPQEVHRSVEMEESSDDEDSEESEEE